MARTKTNTRNDTKTLTTSWRNRHLDKLYFCVFLIFLFFFSFYDNFLNEFKTAYEKVSPSVCRCLSTRLRCAATGNGSPTRRKWCSWMDSQSTTASHCQVQGTPTHYYFLCDVYNHFPGLAITFWQKYELISYSSLKIKMIKTFLLNFN